MLPKLYTLSKIPVVGHQGSTVPPSIYRPECNRPAGRYREIELILDTIPSCDLMTDMLSGYYVTQRLLAELQRYDLRGYITGGTVSLDISEDFFIANPDAPGVPESLRDLQLLHITGRCDGPWIRHRKDGTCSTCGQAKSTILDHNKLVDEILERSVAQPVLVYPETWHGEDFFRVTEPGPAVVTERVAAILAATGNLKREKVENQELIRRLMPKYAERLEAQNWEIDLCVTLGPADWAQTA